MGGLSSKPCPWDALSDSPVLVDTGTVDLPGGLASSTALLRTKVKGKTVTVLDGFDKTTVLYSVKKKHGKGTVTNASGQLIMNFKKLYNTKVFDPASGKLIVDMKVNYPWCHFLTPRWEFVLHRPDGRSITVQVVEQKPENWTVFSIDEKTIAICSTKFTGPDGKEINYKRNTGILIARGVDLGLAALLVSLMQLRVEDTLSDTIELGSNVGCGFLGAV
ncbi:hypothetical protein FA10DRAFT_268906 [Acaromyces ingoldii]|uniref:Uncharacterized protein n=1 Tax=Acaromyces ingoldii TaxID=215250 RepID=A0A316YJG7_9BASI|nr:hypothetical protein FA10DRAFT_268906 [Acaromyces ingoldii]PWN88758.1 hypothetical protein FA10DRAFT_268906 [Acaromyces ingoldii]